MHFLRRTRGIVFSGTGLLIGLLTLANVGSATPLVIPIGGAQANITGCALVNSSGVFFFNSLCTVANTFDASAPDTGSYAGLTGGTIKSLLGAPATGPISIVDFATFLTPGGTVHFDLTNIQPGTGTAAGCANNNVGNNCTIAGSPFTLSQTASDKVAISLSFTGVAYLGTSATGTSPTSVAFTTQNLLPGTISGILAAVNSPAGFQNSFSGTFASVSAVPEPATFGLLLVGGIFCGVIRKRLIAS